MNKRLLLSAATIAVMTLGTQAGWGQEAPKRVAVFPIVTAANVSHWWSGNFEPGTAMTAIITDQLSQSHRYAVYDRQNLDKIAQEQNMGTAGQVTPETAARVGKLAGVQYLLTGTVVEFDQVKQSGLHGFNLPGGVSVGGGGKRVRVTVELRMTSVNSGQISSVRGSAEAVVNDQSFSGFIPGTGIGVGGGSEEFASSALGKDMIAAATDAVQKLDNLTFNEAPAPPPVEGAIIDIAGPQITLNVGAKQGIVKGMKFSVTRTRLIVDPTTNKSREIHSPVGEMTVIAVDDDTCTCKAGPSASSFKLKDKAKLGD